ncbi:unnamed protein product [Prorocentrum cordatum]|uniref:Uncharacterized protein n=1 Tax=Prorocentrum cordatum TaxID=2364126 RepID=A0ABN9XBN8_9DINO|nr:unnamed protein product [Polarella glacialis]
MLELWESQAAYAKVPSLRLTQSLVHWQGDCLVAMAEGQPEPPMRAEFVEFGRIQDELAASGREPSPPPRLDIAAELPFAEKKLSGKFLAEYTRLMNDHSTHVQAGCEYGDFDQIGKELYLDKMADICLRWEEQFWSAQELGIRPTRGFQEVSSEYLRLGDRYGCKQVVEEVHAKMRAMAAGGVVSR